MLGLRFHMFAARRVVCAVTILVCVVSLGVATRAQTPPSRKPVAPLQVAAATGTITLAVDASEAPRKIFHARLTIPAQAGEMTLVYPKWIPGEHGPTGPIDDVAALRFSANGQSLAWRRDDADMYAFHITVPAGAASIDATFDYLSPAAAE